MKTSRLLKSFTAAAALSLMASTPAFGALTVIEDFADGAGDASFGIFGFGPTGSGQSAGLLGTSTSAVSATQWDFTPSGESAYVNTLSIDDDPATNGGTAYGATVAWTIRHFANGSPRDLGNAGPTGYVGFYARTTDDDITVRIALDETGGSGGTEASNELALIGDGDWHLYEVNLADAASWNALFGGNGVIDGTSNQIDSLLIYNTGPNDGLTTALDLAYVSYESTGPIANLVPEPASLALIGTAGLFMIGRRRQA